MFKTVLFPIDQSQESLQAVETVAQLTQSFHCRLVILSVVEDNTSAEAEAANGGMTSHEVVAELLKNAQTFFADQQITAETIERVGKPAFVICDVADDIEADLIVMGCRGMGLTQEGVEDSITIRVINLSPCPVLIVP